MSSHSLLRRVISQRTRVLSASRERLTKPSHTLIAPANASPMSSSESNGDSMPIIDADELNTRHNEYLRQMRQCTTLYLADPAKAGAMETEAKRQYAAWFQERGVMLIFPSASDPL